MSFREWLELHRACPEALAWLGKRGLKRAWRDCKNEEWMIWLLAEMAGEKGWPRMSSLTAGRKKSWLIWEATVDRTDSMEKADLAQCKSLRKVFKIGPLPKE